MKNDKQVAVVTKTDQDVLQVASVSFVITVTMLSLAALLDIFLISFIVTAL